MERLAVCSWSLQPAGAMDLVDKLKQVGLRRVQLALDPLWENPAAWESWGELCHREKIGMVSGMFGTAGEDYTSLDSIQRTGGVVPDETWEENLTRIPRIVELAHRYGISLVTFHAGFIPHDEGDPAYAKLLERLALVADLFQARGIELAFETGQETAADLNRFLTRLGRAHVGVNFDPANMLLYDQGDPIQALRALAPWLRQCHIKDARRTQQPGTWGEEVVVGTGEVDWSSFFQVLDEVGFRGSLAIEREAGNRRVEDIRSAVAFLTSK